MSDYTLVFFPGSLGDFICFLPALYTLGDVTLGRRVEVVARGELHELAKRLPFVCRVFSIDSGYIARLFSPLTAEEEAVRDFEPFCPQPSEIFSWLGYSQPEVRANLNRFAPGRAHSFPFFTGQEECHASAYYLRCVRTDQMRCSSLLLDEKEKQWRDEYWQRRGWSSTSRVFVMHPGSGGEKKRWAAEGFMEVGRWWRGRSGKTGKPGHHVLILLGPAEEQEAERWRQIGAVEQHLSLWQVAALVSRADLYLGNDSGVSHLAGAVGARGAVLFGPTHPQLWRPLGGALSVIQNESYRASRPKIPGISLEEISVPLVIDTLARWTCLSRTRREGNMG